MYNALGYNVPLMLFQGDGFTIFDINEKFTIECEEKFILNIVLMPMILSFENSKPDYRFVYLA